MIDRDVMVSVLLAALSSIVAGVAFWQSWLAHRRARRIEFAEVTEELNQWTDGDDVTEIVGLLTEATKDLPEAAFIVGELLFVKSADQVIIRRLSRRESEYVEEHHSLLRNPAELVATIDKRRAGTGGTA